MHPLGGLARRQTLVDQLRKDTDGVIVVDAGDDLTGAAVPDSYKAPRGQLILDALKKLPVDAWVPGERDTAAGIDLDGAFPRGALVNRAGIRVAVVSRDLDAPVVAPLADEARGLRKAGARIVVALVHGPFEKAKALLADCKGAARIDVAVESHGRMFAQAERIGETWFVECPPQDKSLCELDLHLLGDDAKVDAPCGEAGPAPIDFVDVGPRAQLATMIGEQRRTIADLQARMVGVAPSVKQSMEQQVAAIRSAIARSEIALDQAPVATGKSWLESKQVPLNGDVADDAAVVAMVRAYKDRVAQLPPPPTHMDDPHHAGFAGAERCGECHKSEYAFWKSTKHAHAWQTLVDKHAEKNAECTPCHVTAGFTMLHDVQCEACHGDGVQHGARPKEAGLVRREVPESVCTSCHNAERAPDFKFAAFRAAIIGPGHGMK